MSEMNHAETVERMLHSAEILSEMQMNTPVDDDIIALEDAVDVLQKATNGELVEAIHAHWINSYSPHNHRCSECDAEFTNVRERYCPNCGALMDEARTGDSLSGKDDNHAAD